MENVGCGQSFYLWETGQKQGRNFNLAVYSHESEDEAGSLLPRFGRR